MERIEALNRHGTPALYGDAANSEVVVHCHLERARALVVTVPDDTSAAMIVTTARDLNPNLPIFARATTEQCVRQLARVGASSVIHPELESGLELVHHTLLSLGFPLRQGPSTHFLAAEVEIVRASIELGPSERTGAAGA